ncbi:hypothetical protein FACS1894176_02290 [Bacteroidia bacterium]|nr:hypothetical protein FACS1894176_02290 [Bacteroidia bacterium]
MGSLYSLPIITMPENLLPNQENNKEKTKKVSEKETLEHQIDDKLSNFKEQSTVSLQTVEREVKEEKKEKQKAEPKNEVSFTASLGMGV